MFFPRTNLRSSITAGVAATFLLLVTLGPLAPSRTTAALTNCAVSHLSLDEEEAAFLERINDYRAANGRAALTVSTNLSRAAAWKVEDLATKEYFTHADSLARSSSTRARDCGYPGDAGENLAGGPSKDTASEAFDMWRNSPGHDLNMLSEHYVQIGIARYHDPDSPYGWYWATSFGLVDDGTDGLVGAASLTSPPPGATLPGASVHLTWTAGEPGARYLLHIGTRQGSADLGAVSAGASRSVTVDGLPADGSTIHVRLWTRTASGWMYTDTSYTAAKQ